MKKFTHVNATTIDEAVSALGQGKAAIIAGGSDILSMMKGYISADLPDTLVNIKTIPGLNYIKEESGMLKIGALTTLAEIAKSSVVQTSYSALAEAARKAGSPELRNMGTIAGNICQHDRCWYYRSEYNAFNCLRKNPTTGICYALDGDNRYHSIFGAMSGCVAVNPSDTAPALVALDARIVTTKQTVSAEDFFAYNDESMTILDDGEIVTEIQVPEFSGKSAFLKFALRKAIDFPIVNCAVAISGGTARICLNAVYNVPYRATAAENAIAGQAITEDSAAAAGQAAVASAVTLANNKYKVQIAKTLVKRAILACA
jgi:xanthine dehydrogenase YagS FAD-binding subunit